MSKTVRTLIVLIALLVMLMFSRGRSVDGFTEGKAISISTEKPVLVVESTNSVMPEKMILLEFFSGL